MKLILLPNGSWVNPQAVTAIRPLKTERGCLGDLHRARVVVHHGCGHIEVLLANDDEHASEMARGIAAEVNGTPGTENR